MKINMDGVVVPATEVRDSIEDILHRIDSTLSGYNGKSHLSRFNAGEKVPASGMFLEMYELAYSYWEASGGALDFAAGPLYDAWGFGFKNSSFPTEEEIAALKEGCGMRLLPPSLPVVDGYVDPALIGNPRLNYNAIAQGYSCDLVAAYLYGIGVKDMLVDIGEIWCDGLNPSGRAWSVGIDRPSDRDPSDEGGKEELSGVWSSEGKASGIVTSGNYRKYYVKDGRKYAHTINPISGRPVEHNLLSATVVSAKSAARSDALATWCMVVGLDEAKRLILENPDLQGCLIYSDEDGKMQEWVSEGFTLK